MVNSEINRGDKYALDNFCGAFDFVASGFQPSHSWRSDPLVASGRGSGFNNQPREWPPGGLEVVC
jgi:hypothetical protein